MDALVPIAYLDAGSGSLILGAIAGGVAGIAVLGKLYFNRFLGLFSQKHRIAADEGRAKLTGDDTSA